MEGMYQRRDLNFGAVKGALGTLLRKKDQPSARFVERQVTTVDSNGELTRPVLVGYVGFPEPEEPPIRAGRRYKTAAFEDKLIPCAEVERNLEGLHSILAARSTPTQYACIRVPSCNGLSDHPGVILWPVNANVVIEYGHEPLVSAGDDHPYFPSLYTAAVDWCKLPQFAGATDERLGRHFAFFPDGRARIGSIQLANDRAVVEINASVSLDGWSLKGGFDDGTAWQSFCVPAQSPATTVPLSPSRYELVLVDPDGDVADFWKPQMRAHTTRSITRLLDGTAQPTLEELVMRCLAAGEGEQVEYKPALNPGHPKIRELSETAIAFANSNGGDILIGVSDHGEIEDVTTAAEYRKWCARQGLNADASSLPAYCEALRNKMLTPLERHPPVRIDLVSYLGCHLVVVHVSAGSNRPYYDQNGIVHVRRGSTNRAAHPDRDPGIFTGGRQN